MFSTIHDPDRVRRPKTSIVRTRTGCQNCRKRRRKCDEGRPECQGCVKRGMKCSGYERTIAFKDVSSLAAESSRKFETARWAALRAEDERLGRKRRRAGSSLDSSNRVETLSSDGGSDLDGDRSSSSSTDPAPPSKPILPRQNRRPPTSFARHASSFSMANSQLPPIDPGLYQNPSPGYQLHDRDHSTSFDVADTEDSPPADSSSLVTYNSNIIDPTATLPPLIIHDSPAREVSLIAHFQTELLHTLPVPMKLGPSYMANSCFRHAILALSSVNQAYLETRTSTGGSQTIAAPPTIRLSQTAVGREHYLCAVSELYRCLDVSDPAAMEQHAAAALMLAYYEIATGSPFGSLRHAKGLDALLSSKLWWDSDPGSNTSSTNTTTTMTTTTTTTTTTSTTALPTAMPEIFKAWRMLRYDVRYISAPWRLSAVQVDAHDAYAGLDPELAIRDVYTLAWNLMGRVEHEASFTPDHLDPDPDTAGRRGGRGSGGRGSRSKQAGVWIRDVAGRVCDTRNVERGDYHVDEIGVEEVLARCERFARSLDCWHERLGAEDKPVVAAGVERPFVVGDGGAGGFDPIVVLEFGGGDKKAFEYMMYVTARLIVSRLLLLFGRDGTGQGRGGGPAETKAWACLLFGVVCGMQHRNMTFSYISPVENVAHAALWCEGVGAINAVLEGVIPHVLARGIPVAELADWLYLKKGMGIARRERLRGRAIRAMFLTLDEDYEKGVFDTRCSLLAFGDYNGWGYFRDMYALEGDTIH